MGSSDPMIEKPGDWEDFGTYEPQPENMVKELAKREGKDPIEFLYVSAWSYTPQQTCAAFT